MHGPSFLPSLIHLEHFTCSVDSGLGSRFQQHGSRGCHQHPAQSHLMELEEEDCFPGMLSPPLLPPPSPPPSHSASRGDHNLQPTYRLFSPTSAAASAVGLGLEFGSQYPSSFPLPPPPSPAAGFQRQLFPPTHQHQQHLLAPWGKQPSILAVGQSSYLTVSPRDLPVDHSVASSFSSVASIFFSFLFFFAAPTCGEDDHDNVMPPVMAQIPSHRGGIPLSAAAAATATARGGIPMAGNSLPGRAACPSLHSWHATDHLRLFELFHESPRNFLLLLRCVTSRGDPLLLRWFICATDNLKELLGGLVVSRALSRTAPPPNRKSSAANAQKSACTASKGPKSTRQRQIGARVVGVPPGRKEMERRRSS